MPQFTVERERRFHELYGIGNVPASIAGIFGGARLLLRISRWEKILCISAALCLALQKDNGHPKVAIVSNANCGVTGLVSSTKRSGSGITFAYNGSISQKQESLQVESWVFNHKMAAKRTDIATVHRLGKLSVELQKAIRPVPGPKHNLTESINT